MNTLTPLGERIKRGMKDADINQTELARRAGSEQSHISNVMYGKSGASNELLANIEKVLHIPSGELILLQAGVKSDGLDKDVNEKIREITSIASELPPGEVDDMIEYARFRLRQAQERRQREKTNEETKNLRRRAAPVKSD